MTFEEKALSDYSNLIWNSKSGLISCFSKWLQSQEEFLARKLGFSQENPFPFFLSPFIAHHFQVCFFYIAVSETLVFDSVSFLCPKRIRKRKKNTLKVFKDLTCVGLKLLCNNIV